MITPERAQEMRDMAQDWPVPASEVIEELLLTSCFGDNDSCVCQEHADWELEQEGKL